MKRHLGERLSALIDGELSDTQRERVLAHLAGCEDCRREAAALRLLKRRMHTLGDAAAGDALTWRLLALRPAGGQGSSARRAARAAPAGGAPSASCLVTGGGRGGHRRAGPDRSGLPGRRRPAAARPEGRPRGGRLHGAARDHHRAGTGRSRPACLRPVSARRSREPLMEFRSRPAGSMSPGTDPAALRVITTAVLVGLVASGVALASGLGLLTGGAGRAAAIGRAGPANGPAQAAGLKLLREAAQACRSLPYQGVEVAWWGPASQTGGDTSVVQVWHQPGGQALTQDPGAQALTQAPRPRRGGASDQPVPLARLQRPEPGRGRGARHEHPAGVAAGRELRGDRRRPGAGRRPARPRRHRAAPRRRRWPPGSGWTAPRACRCARKCSTPGRA